MGVRPRRQRADRAGVISHRPLVVGWDDATKAYVVKVIGDTWMVSVAPQLFYDHLFLTHVSQWPREWVAGWAYEQGTAARVAAEAWDPSVDAEPAGYLRVIADARGSWIPGETLTWSEYMLRGDD